MDRLRIKVFDQLTKLNFESTGYSFKMTNECKLNFL